MKPEEKIFPLDDVSLLSRSFARCLVEKGFGPRDLVAAANEILTQAIALCPPQETTPKPSLKVIDSKSGKPTNTNP